MKTHEITTSKGEFMVVYLPSEVKTVQDSFCDAILTTHHDGHIETYYPYEDSQVEELKLICKLSQATEEDAKLIVDSQISGNVLEGIITDLDTHRIEIYTYGCIGTKFISATVCLHSLLKSKGIDINNGNWYLFKKI